MEVLIWVDFLVFWNWIWVIIDYFLFFSYRKSFVIECCFYFIFRFICKLVCLYLNCLGIENIFIFVKWMSVCLLYRNIIINIVDFVECVVFELSLDVKIYFLKILIEILWCFYYKDFDCLLMYLSYLKYF